MDVLIGTSVVLGRGCHVRAAAWLTNSAENSLSCIVGAGRRGLSVEWSTQEGVGSERSTVPLAIDPARRPRLLFLRPLPALRSLVACYSAAPDAILVSTSANGPTYQSSTCTSPALEVGVEARVAATAACATGPRPPVPNTRLVILTFVSPDRRIPGQEKHGSLNQHRQRHNCGTRSQSAIERLQMDRGTRDSTCTVTPAANEAADDPASSVPEPLLQPATNDQKHEQLQQHQSQYQRVGSIQPVVKRARLRAPGAASASAGFSQVPGEAITEIRDRCRVGAGASVADIGGASAAQSRAGTATNTACPWSIYEPRLPGAMPPLPPLWHPDTTCALCLECWTEPVSRTLAEHPAAPTDSGLNGSVPSGADVPSISVASAATWSRLPPLQQLAFLCGCDHVAVVPELYRGLFTLPSCAPPSRPPPPAAPGSAPPAVPPVARQPSGCFLVGTDSGQLWVHPLEGQRKQAPLRDGEAGTWDHQGRREGELAGAPGGRNCGCNGPELLFDLQEPLAALLPVMHPVQPTEAPSGGGATVSDRASAAGSRGAVAEFLPVECAAALLVVGSRGRVVALSPAPAAASLIAHDAAEPPGRVGRARGSSGGRGPGCEDAAVGAPAGLLAGARLQLLCTREWFLGGPVKSAVVTGGGALVWTTPSPARSACSQLDSSKDGARVKVLTAQLVAADLAGSSPCGRDMFLPEIWPLCLSAPASVRQLSPCLGTQHLVLALCCDGTAVMLQARLPPPTPRPVGPPVAGAPARSSGIATSVVSGCAAGLLAAMAQGGGVQQDGGITATVRPNGVRVMRQSEALQQQLRHLMDALARLAVYEAVLRRTLEVQWTAFQTASQDLSIIRSLTAAAPTLRCRLNPQLVLSAHAVGSSIVPGTPGSTYFVELLIEVELLAGRQLEPPGLGSISLISTPPSGHLLLRFLPHDPFLPSSCACIPLTAGAILPVRHRVLMPLPVLALGCATAAGATGGSELLPFALHPSKAQLWPFGGTLQAMLLRFATARVLEQEARQGLVDGSRNGLLTPLHQRPWRRDCVDHRRPHRNAATINAVVLLGQQTVTSAALLQLHSGTGGLRPSIATAPYALRGTAGDAACTGFPGHQVYGQVASRGLSSLTLLHLRQVQLLVRLPPLAHMDRASSVVAACVGRSTDDAGVRQQQQPAWGEQVVQRLLALLKCALLLPEGPSTVGLRGALQLCEERAKVRWLCLSSSRSDSLRMGSAVDRKAVAAGDKASKPLPLQQQQQLTADALAEVEQRQPVAVKVSLELLADCPALLASLNASLQTAWMDSSRSRSTSSGGAAANDITGCNVIDGSANRGGNSGGGGRYGVPQASTAVTEASRVDGGFSGLPCLGALQSGAQLREAIRVLHGLSSILLRVREQQQQLLSISATLRMQGRQLSPRQLQQMQKQHGERLWWGRREVQEMEWEGKAACQLDGEDYVQAVVLKVRQLRAALQDAYVKYGDVAASCMLLEMV